jgi:hypothetical protein
MGFPSVHTVTGRLAAFAIFFTLSACSQDTGGLITLQPDPDLNTAAEVANQLATLEIMLDAVGGFEAVGDQQTSAGDFRAEDIDSDSEAELLAEIDVSGMGDLPKIWLSSSRNAGKDIAVRLRGLDPQDQLTAYGGKSPGRLIADDKMLDVTVPFNLVRGLRKPTVVAVTPLALPAGTYLGSIGFYLSTPLDQSSLPGHVRLRLASDSAAEVDVPGTLTGPRTCPFGTEMWTFTPSQCHRLGSGACNMRLVIDPQVTDSQGRQIQGPDGTPGFDKTITCTGLDGLGDCPPAKDCTGADIGPQSDIVCDRQTGLVHAAACSVGMGGCESLRDSYDWLLFDDLDTCQSYRPDSLMADGLCIAANPWPCQRDQDCQGIGPGVCDPVSEHCTPESCQDQCSGDVSHCVTDQGCLPRLGGCTDDCDVFGSCPELSQTCTLLENGMRVCR